MEYISHHRVVSTATRTGTKRKTYGSYCVRQRLADVVYNLPEFEYMFSKVCEYRLTERWDEDGIYIQIESLEGLDNDDKSYRYQKVLYLYCLADWIQTLGYQTWVKIRMRKI